MQLTIDNLDAAGARDYTCNLDADTPPRLQRRLNRPAEMKVALVAGNTDFTVPVAGARVLLARRNGAKLFTGYIEADPELEYLGQGEPGPVYRYTILARSDESLLDRKTVPVRPPFIARTAGSILKELAGELLPGAFDVAGVQDVDTLPSYTSSPQKTWSEHAAEVALLGRASYRAHDGALLLSPVGANEYLLDEAAPEFRPDGLKLRWQQRLMNDVSVIGNDEPNAYVKDYFLGDGLTLDFWLSHDPFTYRNHSFLDEEYADAALSPLRWTATDPGGTVSVSGGNLRVEGGTGVEGETTVWFNESVELAGALLLQHGAVEFTAPSSGILGGLYSGGLDGSHCIAGFRITTYGSQSRIRPVINGVAAGSTLTTAASHRYALSTRVYASEMYRRQQTFHSSAHPAGSGRGGAALPASAHLVLEVHDIDPANPGSQAAKATVLYDGVLASVPDFCTYAVVNAAAMHCSLQFTRLSHIIEADVSSTIPGQPSRTRLVGAISDGAECKITSSPELWFYSQYVPVANEAIRVSYRSRSQAAARITDPDSIAANARGNDDGVRGGIRRVAKPAPRTAVECELAALALLDDSTQPAVTGEYETWSTLLPQAAADMFPGDALMINVPSRSANIRAIVREVEVELRDLAGENALYKLRFANEAAEPLGFAFDSTGNAFLADVTATTSTAGTSFIGDLAAAEVTGITSTTVTINAGAAPPAGGGIEVRYSDYGWGQANDRNLAGRFTTQTFTVTRLTRLQTYYLRQYDASSPPKYSRYSAALYIGYPS
ncbi:MAG: hypothetical protein ACE14M_00270 [Terriglobales bacterium]